MRSGGADRWLDALWAPVVGDRQDSCLLPAGTPRGGAMTVGGAAGGRESREDAGRAAPARRVGGRRVGAADRVSRSGAVRWRAPDAMTGFLPWGRRSSVCACLSGVALGVWPEVWQPRPPSAEPDHPVMARRRIRVNARAHHRFRLCSGRPTADVPRLARIGDRRRRRAPATRARDGIHAGATLDLRFARPVGRSPQDRRRRGLHNPDTRPGSGHPARPRRVATSSPRPRPAPARPPPSSCPILDRLRPHANTSFSPARHPVRVLILVPTRELAMQVDESVRTYGRTVPLRSTVVYGGIPMDPQIKALRGGVEILVATPGRLLDLVGQKVANLGQVEILVLDEADRMLDMGFLPDIQRIIELLPAQAPEPDVLGDVLRRHPAPVGHDPARPGDGRGRAAEHGGRGRPPARLPGRPRPQGGAARPPHPEGRPAPGPGLHADEAGRHAARHRGSTARASTPSPSTRDRSQPERTRALEGFKTGEIRVLVATDVAARGLDIEDLPVVVNFELPWNPQDYIHRIGRTGRAGATGEAISLVCIDEVDLLRGVQRMLKHGDPVDGRGRLRPRSRRRAAAAGDARRATPGRARSITPTASRSAGARAASASGPRGAERSASARGPAQRPGAIGPAAGRGSAAPPRRSGAGGSIAAPGKKKPSMRSALDALDAVAVDQRVVADRHDGSSPGRRDRGVTSRSSTNSPVGRVRARPGSKPGSVGSSPSTRTGPTSSRMRVPGGVDRDGRVVVGDGDEDVVDRRSSCPPAAGGAAPSSGLPAASGRGSSSAVVSRRVAQVPGRATMPLAIPPAV